LGSIGTEACRTELANFLHDPDLVVRQSCEVALDIADYWSSDEFESAIETEQ